MKNLEMVIDILEVLELGDNRIRVIENLDDLTNLKQLFLGKNKITKLQNMNKLVNLKTLSIQSNRITKIENMEALTVLDDCFSHVFDWIH